MSEKILFVCKHNRFRSKIAEAFFNKINKNKKFRAYSAGVFKGFPVHNNVISVGKKLGIYINKKTKGLSERLVKDMDTIIIVADDIPTSLFKNKTKKIIKWKIPDANQADKNRILFISNKIKNKVKNLVKDLR